jgi:hypothetical protein
MSGQYRPPHEVAAEVFRHGREALDMAERVAECAPDWPSLKVQSVGAVVKRDVLFARLGLKAAHHEVLVECWSEGAMVTVQQNGRDVASQQLDFASPSEILDAAVALLAEVK